MKMPSCQLNIIKPIFIKQNKGKPLKETGGVIITIEILIHDSVSEISEVLKEAEVVHCVKFISYRAVFWPQACNSILKVQIAIFSPFGNVQFLFKHKNLLCE